MAAGAGTAGSAARTAADSTSGDAFAAGRDSDVTTFLSGATSRLTATDTDTTNVTAPATSMASGAV
jgi:hypothetical protein